MQKARRSKSACALIAPWWRDCISGFVITANYSAADLADKFRDFASSTAEETPFGGYRVNVQYRSRRREDIRRDSIRHRRTLNAGAYAGLRHGVVAIH